MLGHGWQDLEDHPDQKKQPRYIQDSQVRYPDHQTRVGLWSQRFTLNSVFVGKPGQVVKESIREPVGAQNTGKPTLVQD